MQGSWVQASLADSSGAEARHLQWTGSTCVMVCNSVKFRVASLFIGDI